MAYMNQETFSEFEAYETTSIDPWIIINNWWTIPANDNFIPQDISLSIVQETSALVDMHCHTSRSDGVSTPQELIQEAKTRGIEVLCITDHDKTSTEIIPMIERAGIATIDSVEISTRNSFGDDRSLHMTCYMQQMPIEIRNILRNTCDKKQELILAQLQHLQQKWFDIDVKEFYQQFQLQGREKSGINKYDIARYIVTKPENRKKLLSIWCEDRGKLHMSFYTLCLKRSGALYWEYGIEIDEYEPELKQVSEIVQDTGGVLSIAHPNFTFSRAGIQGFERLYREVYQKLWIQAIEINTRASKKWVDAILSLKSEFGDSLQLTFGSDCHRIGKPDDKHGDLGFENDFVSQQIMSSELYNFREKLWF